MFCGNCGSKIEDGAKFCPSCGSPVAAAPEAETPVEPVTAAPIQPVAETPVEPVAAEPVKPVQPAPVQGTPSDMLFRDPVQPAQTVQNPQPVKKKKGKAGLIAGLTAGAVVIGGGAVGYFGFHDDITRMVMGNAEYARMIDKKAYERMEVDEKDSDKLAEYAAKSFDEVVLALRTTRDRSESSEETDEIIEQLLGTTRSLGSGFDALPEGTSITTESSLNVKLGSVFAMLDNKTTRSVLDAVNSLKFKEKLANGETDLMSFGIDDGKGHTGSADIYINDGSILITFPNISDKKIYIPKEEIEKYSDAQKQEERKPLDPAEIKRIREEIVNIYYDAYDTAEITFTDVAEWSESVTGSMGDITASVKGNQMRVYFTAEQLEDIFGKATELIKNDEYLLSYAKDTLGISGEDYKKAFESGKDKADEVKFDLAVTHIVDVHNNVLASEISVLPKENDTVQPTLTVVENKDASVMHVNIYNSEEGSTVYILAGDKKTSKTDGNAVLRVMYDKRDIDLAVECAYTGKETKTFLGKDVTTGKYTVTLSDPDKFMESAGKIIGAASSSGLPDLGSIVGGITDNDIIEPTAVSFGDNGLFGGNKAIVDELKKLTLTFESSVEGDVYTASSEISLGDIGSLAFSSRAERRDETVTMPDTAGALGVDDTKEISDIGLDALKWAQGAVAAIDGGNGTLSEYINEAVESAEKEKRFTAHYSEYSSWSVYDAPSSASTVYYALYDVLNETDVRDGVIKLYFKDGKCEIIDDAGVDGINIEDDELDSVYAEIFVNKAVSDTAVGVTAVLTDDKNDLPDKLPTIFNYIDGVYPWEDSNGIIGDFVVGAYPYLSNGEPTTNELPAGAPVLDDLNGFALYISDAVTDFLGASGDLGQFRRSSGSEAVISYKCDENGSWSVSGGFLDGMDALSYPVADELVDEILDRLNSVSEEFKNMKNVTADIYFYNGKFAGTAVFNNDSYLSYKYTYGVIGGTDLSSGSFAHWAETDGETAAGYIDRYGDLVPVGTYSLKTGEPLAAGSSADIGGDYDGTWTITAMNGVSIEDLNKLYQASGIEIPNLYVVISGSRLILHTTDEEPIEIGLEYGTEYDGKPAAALIEEGQNIGVLVFDGTTAQMIEENSNTTIDLVWEGRDVPAGAMNGEFKEYPEISDIAGKWHGAIGGTEQDVIIDSNAVFGAYDGDLLDSEFYLLNPTQYGFDIFEDGQYIVGNIGYEQDNNVLIISDSFTDETVRFTWVETAPLSAYAGDWTVETIDGLSPEAYAEANDVSVDDVAINMSIGAYSALLEYSAQYELGTLSDISGSSFRVESVDDGYFDCTYSAITKKITANINSNDGDTLGVIVFKRGTAARG